MNIKASLRLRALALYGIGSYLEPATIEVRPITLLCGANGSGKSTWLRVFHAVRECLVKGNFPFLLSPDLLNQYLSEHWAGWGDYPEDAEYGPPGTIRLDFEVLEDIKIDDSLPELEHLPPLGINAGIDFLWYGLLPAGTQCRLWISTAPTESSKYELHEDCPNRWARLELDQRYDIRFERPGDQARRSIFRLEDDVAANFYVLLLSNNCLEAQGGDQQVLAGLLDPTYAANFVNKSSNPIIPYAARLAHARLKKLGLRIADTLWDIDPFRVRRSWKERDEEYPQGLRAVASNGMYTHKVLGAFRDKMVRRVHSPYFPQAPREFFSVVGLSIFSDRVPGVFEAALQYSWQEQVHDRGTPFIRALWALTPDAIHQRIRLFLEKVEPLPAKDPSDHDVEVFQWRLQGLQPDLSRERAELICDFLNAVLQNSDLFDFLPKPSEVAEDTTFLLGIPRQELHPLDFARLSRRYFEDAAREHAPEFEIEDTHFTFGRYCSAWLSRIAGVRLGSDILTEWAERGEIDATPLDGYVLIDSEENLRNEEVVDSKFVNVFGQYDDVLRFSAGFHQVAPIVVQSAAMKIGETLGIENPELQLHPNAQLRIMEFCLNEARTSKQLIVETQSELLVRRVLRALIQEELPQEAIRIYFTGVRQSSLVGTVDKKESTSYTERVLLDEYGHIQNWPAGFLEADISESQALLASNPEDDLPSEEGDDFA